MAAGMVGFCGYGLSLVWFVLALRHLGTARTGAYFSAVPCVDSAISQLMPGDRPDAVFWIVATLMGAGIWLHLTESHEHEDGHEPIFHAHAHSHDAHHQHEHDSALDGRSRMRIYTITGLSGTPIRMIRTSIIAMSTELTLEPHAARGFPDAPRRRKDFQVRTPGPGRPP